MRNKKSKMVFALKEHKLVSIDDIERGDKYCFCSYCNEQLVAKKGEKRSHHFAHLNAECKYAEESSLHYLAKEIISRNPKFVLPPNVINYKHKKIEIDPAQEIIIEDVYMETFCDGFKPDLIIKSKGLKYAVEIYVTHKIDEEKRQKIKDVNLPTIEINLSKIEQNQRNNASVIEQIINDIIKSSTDERKYWVFHNNQKNIEDLKKSIHYEYGKEFVKDCCFYDYENKTYDILLEKCKQCKHLLKIEERNIICEKTTREKNANIGNISNKIIKMQKGNIVNIVVTNCPKLVGSKESKTGRIVIEQCLDCIYFQGVLDGDNIVCGKDYKCFKCGSKMGVEKEGNKKKIECPQNCCSCILE